MYVNQYQTPKDYAIPNPLGPRVHNWRGGPLNQGSLYHGPVYTRPSYRMPWMMRPSLRGIDLERELVVSGFLVLVHAKYPDLEASFGAERNRRISKDGQDAADERLLGCIKEQFPAGIDAGTGEGVTFSRNRAEKVLSCYEGVKLGVVLPLVGAGALLIWLFARK